MAVGEMVEWSGRNGRTQTGLDLGTGGPGTTWVFARAATGERPLRIRSSELRTGDSTGLAAARGRALRYLEADGENRALRLRTRLLAAIGEEGGSPARGAASPTASGTGDS